MLNVIASKTRRPDGSSWMTGTCGALRCRVYSLTDNESVLFVGNISALNMFMSVQMRAFLVALKALLREVCPLYFSRSPYLLPPL